MTDYLQNLFGLHSKAALITSGTMRTSRIKLMFLKEVEREELDKVKRLRNPAGSALKYIECAVALAAAGADIILVQRDLSNVATKQRIQGLGRKCSQVEGDLADPSSVKTLVQKVVDQGLHFDIVVNCGGIQRRAPAVQFSDEDFNEVLQVNLNAVWAITRDAGRYMLENRSGKQYNNKIINIASLLSFQGGLTVPAYTASKHAVLGVTKACSNEWSSQGINVNCIAPGYIATDMNEGLMANEIRARQILERIPAQRWGKPQDFAGAIVFLASPASDYVCAETLVVDGGWMGR